jgi:hypothetical protein
MIIFGLFVLLLLRGGVYLLAVSRRTSDYTFKFKWLEISRMLFFWVIAFRKETTLLCNLPSEQDVLKMLS